MAPRVLAPHKVEIVNAKHRSFEYLEFVSSDRAMQFLDENLTSDEIATHSLLDTTLGTYKRNENGKVVPILNI